MKRGYIQCFLFCLPRPVSCSLPVFFTSLKYRKVLTVLSLMLLVTLCLICSPVQALAYTNYGNGLFSLDYLGSFYSGTSNITSSSNRPRYVTPDYDTDYLSYNDTSSTAATENSVNAYYYCSIELASEDGLINAAYVISAAPGVASSQGSYKWTLFGQGKYNSDGYGVVKLGAGCTSSVTRSLYVSELKTSYNAWSNSPVVGSNGADMSYSFYDTYEGINTGLSSSSNVALCGLTMSNYGDYDYRVNMPGSWYSFVSPNRSDITIDAYASRSYDSDIHVNFSHIDSGFTLDNSFIQSFSYLTRGNVTISFTDAPMYIGTSASPDVVFSFTDVYNQLGKVQRNYSTLNDDWFNFSNVELPNIYKLISAAQNTANSASTAASNAQQTASSAQNTANSASTAASNAQQTASSAQNTANSASTAASNAQQTASSAQNTANQALDIANDASSDAESAITIGSDALSAASANGNRLDGFDSDINALAAANDNTNKIIDGIQEQLNAVDEQFEGFGATVSKLDTDLSTISNDVLPEIQAQLDYLNEEVNSGSDSTNTAITEQTKLINEQSKANTDSITYKLDDVNTGISNAVTATGDGLTHAIAALGVQIDGIQSLFTPSSSYGDGNGSSAPASINGLFGNNNVAPVLRNKAIFHELYNVKDSLSFTTDSTRTLRVSLPFSFSPGSTETINLDLASELTKLVPGTSYSYYDLANGVSTLLYIYLFTMYGLGLVRWAVSN